MGTDRTDDRAWRPAALMAWGGVALAMLAGAAVPTDTWLALFAHPAREPTPETTIDGVRLWRAMLASGAVVGPGLWWLLHIVSRQRAHGASLRETSSPAMSFNWDRPTGYAVLGLVLVAIVFRMPRLNEGLWYDEISAWAVAGQFGPGPIMSSYFDPANHIGQTLLAWLSVTALGPLIGEATAMRLPTVLASLLTVPAMFLLGAAAGGRRAGLIAAALAALLPVMILSGVEARGYGLMIAAAAWSTVLWIAARERRGPGLWLTYAAVSAIGVWAHPLTAFVMIGHGAVGLWTVARTRDRSALAGVVGVAAAGWMSVTLYAPALPDLLAQRGMFAADTADQPRLWGVEGFHALLQMGGSWTGWAALPGLAAVVLGLTSFRERSAQRAILALLLAGLIVFIVVVLIAGLWTYARFMLFAMPGAIVAMTLGVECCWRRRRWLGYALLGAILCGGAADLATRPVKQPLREAAAIVRERRQPNETLLVIGIAHRVMDYYLGGLPQQFSPLHGVDLSDQLRASDPDCAIVLYPDRVGPQRLAMLEEDGLTLIAVLDGWVDWGRGTVLVYQRQ